MRDRTVLITRQLPFRHRDRLSEKLLLLSAHPVLQGLSHQRMMETNNKRISFETSRLCEHTSFSDPVMRPGKMALGTTAGAEQLLTHWEGQTGPGDVACIQYRYCFNS